MQLIAFPSYERITGRLLRFIDLRRRDQVDQQAAQSLGASGADRDDARSDAAELVGHLAGARLSSQQMAPPDADIRAQQLLPVAVPLRQQLSLPAPPPAVAPAAPAAPGAPTTTMLDGRSLATDSQAPAVRLSASLSADFAQQVAEHHDIEAGRRPSPLGHDQAEPTARLALAQDHAGAERRLAVATFGYYDDDAHIAQGMADLAHLERWRLGGISRVVSARRFGHLAGRLLQRSRQDLLQATGTDLPSVDDSVPTYAAYICGDVQRMRGKIDHSQALLTSVLMRPSSPQMAFSVSGKLALITLEIIRIADIPARYMPADAGSPAEHLEAVHAYLRMGISSAQMASAFAPDGSPPFDELDLAAYSATDPHWLAARAETLRRMGDLAQARRVVEASLAQGPIFEARRTRDQIRQDQRRARPKNALFS